MRLTEAIRYAVPLGFNRLLDRAIQQQRSFRPSAETPTPAHALAGGFNTWLELIRQVDPKAAPSAVTHLHNAAAVLAGTAQPDLLKEDFHSDQSPLVGYLKLRLPKTQNQRNREVT